MFYDVFVELCSKKGVKPTRAALDIGLSKATPTLWKKRGYTPRGDIINKIAAYFGVSVDYLLGNEESGKPAPTEGDGPDELVKDELVGFYGNVKDHLTQADIEDIKTLMKIRAELNRAKEE